MNLHDVLRDQLRQRPQAIAIIEPAGRGTRSWTFAELDARARRWAALFASRGLVKGDPVLVFHPMAGELYAVLIAAFSLGLVAVFIDPSAGREHVARCCRLLAPRAFLGTPKAHVFRLAVRELRRIPLQFSTSRWIPGAASIARIAADAASVASADCAGDDPALVTFTSGSTGEPKAVVRSHGFLLAQHRVLAETFGFSAGLRDLTTLPVFLLANLASGMTSIIPDADLRRPGSIRPEAVFDQIDALAPETTGASPAFVERLCEHAERTGRTLAPLRTVYAGGAPVFPSLLLRAQRLLPEGELVAVYGSTEAEPIAHIGAREIGPPDLEAMGRGEGLLTGRPVPSLRFAIIRDRWGQPIGPFDAASFARERLATDEIGEIVVSGDHVVRGYLHGRGEAETKFEVGSERWHRTGDLGRLDVQGRLWLLGRCAAAIRDERGELHPFAVECAAQQIAGVRRAALLLHDGARLLVVEPERGATPLPQRVSAALAWAELDRVLVVAAIPVDARHNAKVDYPQLRAEIRRLL